MDIRCYQRLRCVCSLIICVLVVVSDADGKVQFFETSFEGVESIREVECSASGEIISINMWDKRDNSSYLVSLLKYEGKTTCTTRSVFAACEISPALAVTVLITDLEEGEIREFQCTVNLLDKSSGATKPETKTIIVTRPLGTAPTSGSNSTIGANSDETSGTKGELKGASLFSNSVVIIILALLVITVTAACVVGAIYCKRRNRKRRKRDCDSLSMRSGMTSKSFCGMSDKRPQFGFDDGPGMQTLTRQLSYSSSAPPKAMAPDVPGQLGRVMQYQKPTDCMPYAGTMASVRSYEPPVGSQYHEPWGKTLDDPEILGRLNTVRGNRGAVVKIPDFEATSSSASYPAPPSASPTQETGPAFI